MNAGNKREFFAQVTCYLITDEKSNDVSIEMHIDSSPLVSTFTVSYILNLFNKTKKPGESEEISVLKKVKSESYEIPPLTSVFVNGVYFRDAKEAFDALDTESNLFLKKFSKKIKRKRKDE